MFSWLSSNTAFPTTFPTSSVYPRVSHAMAVVTRSGVFFRPSRQGSSPSSSSCRRTRLENSRASESLVGCSRRAVSARIPLREILACRPPMLSYDRPTPLPVTSCITPPFNRRELHRGYRLLHLDLGTQALGVPVNRGRGEGSIVLVVRHRTIPRIRISVHHRSVPRGGMPHV